MAVIAKAFDDGACGGANPVEWEAVVEAHGDGGDRAHCVYSKAGVIELKAVWTLKLEDRGDRT